MGPRIVTIQTRNEGQRIDNFLMTYLKGVPKSRIYRLLRTGQIRVNKGRVKAGFRVHEGDMIRIPPIRQSSHTDSGLAKPPQSLIDELRSRQLYVDEDMIILNKPAGIAVHGGSGIRFGVIEAMRACYPHETELDLVHRLDRDTSGCLLIARKRSVLKYLHTMLHDGAIEKHYLALLAGNWNPGEHIVDTPLTKTRRVSGERMVRVDDEGRSSRSRFTVVQNLAGCCLARINLDTGRMHQIRVHAASQGHAVAGDRKYGDRDFNRRMKAYGLGRLFLHATGLTFRHPSSAQLLNTEAPLDADLARVLDRVRSEGQR